jgi:protein subunit release factor A
MYSIHEIFEKEKVARAAIAEQREMLATVDKESREIAAALTSTAQSHTDEDANALQLFLHSYHASSSQELTALRNRQSELASIASMLTREINSMRAELASLEEEKVRAVLRRISRARKEHIVELRDAIGGMAASIASLLASDIIQHRLIGQQFAYDPRQHPELVSGRALASQFLEGIPAALRPSSLYSGEIEKMALQFARCVDFCSDPTGANEDDEL